MLRGLAAPLNIIKVHVLKVLKQHSAPKRFYGEDSPWVFVVFQKKNLGEQKSGLSLREHPKARKKETDKPKQKVGNSAVFSLLVKYSFPAVLGLQYERFCNCSGFPNFNIPPRPLRAWGAMLQGCRRCSMARKRRDMFHRFRANA